MKVRKTKAPRGDRIRILFYGIDRIGLNTLEKVPLLFIIICHSLLYSYRKKREIISYNIFKYIKLLMPYSLSYLILTSQRKQCCQM